MRRKITGKIYKIDDTPWINAKGCIILKQSSYTPNVVYPESSIYYLTDIQGNVLSSEGTELYLWCNEESINASKYEWIMPDFRSWFFTVPVGDTPLTISYLKDNLNTTPYEYNSIVSYVDERLDTLESHYELFNTVINQITYTLSYPVLKPDTAKVFFNGLKQRLGVDYVIDGSTLRLINILPQTFIVEIFY